MMHPDKKRVISKIVDCALTGVEITSDFVRFADIETDTTHSDIFGLFISNYRIIFLYGKTPRNMEMDEYPLILTPEQAIRLVHSKWRDRIHPKKPE